MSFGVLQQFYVLSARGDSIIFRDFRSETGKSTAEVFFRNCRFWQGKQQEAPPIFNVEGVSFLWMKKQGLYFVLTSRDNVSPLFALELVRHLCTLFKDYCGVLSEESIRSNFVLLYEIIDEIIDYGFVQGINTDSLKTLVHNEPVIVQQTKQQDSSFKIPDINPKTTPSTAVDKPITIRDKKSKKNEIFVDIFERVSVTFNSNGGVLNSSIDGTIQMKSYLSGNPELKVALNEDLVVGKGGARTSRSYGVVELDDCNFHECVRLNDFESLRILSLQPPDGEFACMNYRITGDFRCPFRIFPFFELSSPYKVELIIKMRADIPEHNYGGNVQVIIPMPKTTSNVVAETTAAAVGQSTEYDARDRRLSWRIKKFVGGSEQTLRTKITLSASATAAIRKEIGPISLHFEIPMFNPSGLQVKYLRIMQSADYKPYRWVRYVTKSHSYVCRL